MPAGLEQEFTDQINALGHDLNDCVNEHAACDTESFGDKVNKLRDLVNELQPPLDTNNMQPSDTREAEDLLQTMAMQHRAERGLDKLIDLDASVAVKCL